jgi:hypothetical protein
MLRRSVDIFTLVKIAELAAELESWSASGLVSEMASA